MLVSVVLQYAHAQALGSSLWLHIGKVQQTLHVASAQVLAGSALYCAQLHSAANAVQHVAVGGHVCRSVFTYKTVPVSTCTSYFRTEFWS